jgi:hypothetical protein
LNKYNAPAVVYPVRRSNIEGVLWVVLWSCGAAACFAWQRWSSPGTWPLVIEVGLLVVTATCSFCVWRNGPPVLELSWGGNDWRGRSATGVGDFELHELVVLADFQRVLVLQAAAQQCGRRWIWIERGMAPDCWMDFRRAVYGAGRGMDDSLLDLGKGMETEPVAVSGSSSLKIGASQQPNHE